MKKKIKAILKLTLQAGKATSAPPVGSILGQYGINIGAFCKEYNFRTQEKIGCIIPIKLIVYQDKSYFFRLKSYFTSKLLLKYANLKKGSSNSKKFNLGIFPKNELLEIINIKLNDLNTKEIEKATQIIKGTAYNMGFKFL